MPLPAFHKVRESHDAYRADHKGIKYLLDTNIAGF